MTISQEKDAADALLDAWPLNAEDRTIRLGKAACVLRATQASNAASRASHAKARRLALLAMGVAVETLRCCIPPPTG